MKKHFIQPGIPSDSSTLTGSWMDGTEHIPLMEVDKMGLELVKIIKSRNDIYALTIHAGLGVYITTSTEPEVKTNEINESQIHKRDA